ncbi:DNA-3-methyladenine glycosylase I [Nocardioides sp. Bht2]|uniref:DNA-3-methyladenine glycosylase I n=1 Tax=Nocardioides sp. Bht2 TaxID=3392297 RepID=UPI0039B4BAB1
MTEGAPVTDAAGITRCPWGAVAGPMQEYHDTEWGVPVHGESAHFERLTLEAFQSGLSWATILAKRPAFRELFDEFDVELIARYDSARFAALMGDARIVRNRLKIQATITNAQAAIALREEGGLADLLWSFRPDRSPEPRVAAEVPTTSAESLALSKALKKKGFTFVGPTTMHALMEAIGLVNTHLLECHRRQAN